MLKKDGSFKRGTFHQDLSYHSNEMTLCPILHIKDRITCHQRQGSYRRFIKRHIRNRSTNQIAGNSFFSSEIILNINVPTWFRGFRVKIVNFLSFLCLPIPKRDLETKKTTPNIEVCPESLGVMLEYWYIERTISEIRRRNLGLDIVVSTMAKFKKKNL